MICTRMIYDYVIIGGGPSGMTLAQLLAQEKQTVLLLEKQETLGGCHRVDRQDNLFTEHGPRVYSSAYVNFDQTVLKTLGTKMSDTFSPYKFNITSIGKKSLQSLRANELAILVGEFFKFMIFSSHGMNISMKEFTKDFSLTSQDYIDRLCRLTDGAGADRYSLNQFLHLANDQSLHTLYQPKLAMDVGIMKKWKEYLESSGYVTIKTQSEVSRLLSSGGDEQTITGVIVNRSSTEIGRNYVLAIQPMSIQELIKNSGLNLYPFGKDFEKYAIATNYIDYIPITFHWKQHLSLPVVYGFPESDWGVAFVVLSDYIPQVDIGSNGTVISTAITKIDSISNFTGKTANQSTPSELKTEVYRQLKISFPDLFNPDKIIISPTVIQTVNGYKTQDTAYVSSAGISPDLPFKSSSFVNLYNLGPQNGGSNYHFTSLESAVSNAIALRNLLSDQGSPKVPILSALSIKGLVVRVLFTISILLLLFRR
jgi:hypothetical protein